MLQAFSEIARADPDRRAAVSDGRWISYGEAMSKAAAICAELRSAGVGPGVGVAAYLPRDLALVPAVLGTWLAGGCYVPLDREGPPGRAEYMLRDSHAHVVLTLADGLPADIEVPVAAIALDASGAVERVSGAGKVVEPRLLQPGSDDLAYVIYTSGSTGRPKGVLIGQDQVAAMAESHEKAVYSGAGNFPARVALNNAVTADSFFSDFVHLASGRTLYIVDGQTRRDPERLGRFLLGNQIEVLDATPTQLRNVLLAGHQQALAALTVLIVGGEATAPDLWRQLRALPGVQPFNMYGPTECTVAVTAASLRSSAEPVIGTALAGCAVWIMDDQLRVVPDGVPGELVITGRQVGRGYLNAAAPDSMRFLSVELPGTGQVVRGYRTGDRGYRNDSGQIVFLGRDDDQVSIGGHRVELGEVEVRLRECPGVLQAAVALLGEARSATLTAWVALSERATPGSVRDWLAAQLPRHMIPVLHAVPAIPMGPTGKADLARLKDSVTAAAAPQDGGEPRQAGAQSLAALIRSCWHEVLGPAEIADDSDFFALGGDSLKATSLILRLRGALDPAMPIRVLFENSRFGDFVAALAERTQGQGG